MAVVDDLAPGMDSAPPNEEFGRQPPQDLAAEQSVLGGMLLSKDAIADVLERLPPGTPERLRRDPGPLRARGTGRCRDRCRGAGPPRVAATRRRGTVSAHPD